MFTQECANNDIATLTSPGQHDSEVSPIQLKGLVRHHFVCHNQAMFVLHSINVVNIGHVCTGESTYVHQYG